MTGIGIALDWSPCGVDSAVTPTTGPLVSVCLPVRNGLLHISTSLRSALAQRYSNIEVIVSDNASNDGTSEILRNFEDKRIRYIRQPCALSMAENWNHAVQAARGRYITLLHADDWYEPRFIENLVGILEMYPTAALASCGVNYVDERRGEVSIYSPVSELTVCTAPSGAERLLAGNFIHCCSVMMRAATLPRPIVFEPQYDVVPDWALWLRLSASNTIVLMSEVLATVRLHADNLMIPLMRAGRSIREERAAIARAVAQLSCDASHRSQLRRRAMHALGSRYLNILEDVCQSGDIGLFRRAIAALAVAMPVMVWRRWWWHLFIGAYFRSGRH